MTNPANLFTPNVSRGNATERYVTYLHSSDVSRQGTVQMSATPDGPVFEAKYERDRCQSQCICGAFVTPLTTEGEQLLSAAKRMN